MSDGLNEGVLRAAPHVLKTEWAVLTRSAQEANAHPNDAALSEKWARAVVVVFQGFLRLEDLPAARELLDGLEDRVTAFLSQLSRAGNQSAANENIATENSVNVTGPLAVEIDIVFLWCDAAVEMMLAYEATGDTLSLNDVLTSALVHMGAIKRADPTQRGAWVAHVSPLIRQVGAYGQAAQVSASQPLVKGIEEAATTCPKDKALRQRVAGMLEDSIKGLCRIDQADLLFDVLQSAQSKVNMLGEFCKAHPKETAVRHHWMRSLGMLITAYFDAKRGDDMWSLVEILLENHRRFPRDLIVREQWALGVGHMIHLSCEAGLIEVPRMSVDHLRSHLVASHLKFRSQRVTMREQWASGAARMVEAYSTKGNAGTESAQVDLSQARNLLYQLGWAVRLYPKDMVVRAHWGAAIGTMVEAYTHAMGTGMPGGEAAKLNLLKKAQAGVRGKLQRRRVAKILHQKNTILRKALTRVKPKCPWRSASRALWARQVVSTLNLTGYQDVEGLLPVAAKLLRALDRAAAKHPNEAAVQGQWIRGVHGLFGAYCEAYEIVAARALLETINQHAAKDPDNEALQHQNLRATTHLTDRLQEDETEEILAAVREKADHLTREYSLDPSLSERFRADPKRHRWQD